MAQGQWFSNVSLIRRLVKTGLSPLLSGSGGDAPTADPGATLQDYSPGIALLNLRMVGVWGWIVLHGSIGWPLLSSSCDNPTIFHRPPDVLRGEG